MSLTSGSADCQSGKLPTTRVRRLISFMTGYARPFRGRSSPLFVLIFTQCSSGNE